MPRLELPFGGLFNSFHESKVPHGRAWACQNVRTDRGVLEGSQRYLLFGARSGTHASDLGWGLGYGKYSNNEVQRLTVTGGPTGGTVVLQFDGKDSEAELNQNTGTIAYNASALTVQNAIEALTAPNVGDIRCTGGPWPSAPIYVEFKGQYANTGMRALVLQTNGLTGGSSPSVTIAEFAAGGSQEEYLAAVQNNGDSTVTMYKVNASTGVFTSVATGLTASAWFFQQMGNRIFAANATDGLHYFRLGGGWDDALGTPPATPSVAPGSFTFTDAANVLDFSAGALNATITATNITETITRQPGGGFTIENSGSSLANNVQVVITANLAAAQDWQFSDIYVVTFSSSPTGGPFIAIGNGLDLNIQDNAGNSYDATERADLVRTTTQQEVWFQFENTARTVRDDIKQLHITLNVNSWNAGASAFISVERGQVRMANEHKFKVPDPVFWTKAQMEYAYSYYNATSTVESPLSPTGSTGLVPSGPYGTWVTVANLYGNPSLTGSDRIYVYRREKATGLWRRLPTDANNLTTFGAANVTSGSTTFIDKWAEYELGNFPSQNVASFGGGTFAASGLVLTAWKRSLVLGAGPKLYMSFVDDPDNFAPDPDDAAATTSFVQQHSTNADRARSVYMADNRAEDVRFAIGQDLLYPGSAQSSFAIAGEAPAGSTPARRLPGSRGAVGSRAANRLAGGAMVGSEDGLWLYDIYRNFGGDEVSGQPASELTEEVRRSWVTTLLGSSYSGLATVEHNDEIWAFNGAKYLHRGRSGQWDEGTFADSVYALVSVRSRGLRFLDSRGRMHTISADYTTDNAAASTWSYETGVMDVPPSRVTDIEMQVRGAPRVIVWVFAQDGPLTHSGFGKYHEYIFDTQDAQEPYRRPLTILPGMRYKVKFSGTVGTDEIHAVAFETQAAGKPLQG